jgi:5-methylthioadenosine/S-adenosylhomocysteine deaminase
VAEDLQLLAVSDGRAAPDPVLIAGGHVVAARGPGVRADVLLVGGRIAAVGPNLEAGDGVSRLDARGRYVLPGLVNAHTHAHNNLSKCRGDRWTLEQLRSRGGGLYGERTPEEQYASAALGAIEMVKSGCTAAYDQFAALPALTGDGIDAVAQAYVDVGLRAVLAPSISDLPFYDVIPGLLDELPAGLRSSLEAVSRAPADRLLELSEAAIDRWHGAAGGRISVGLAPVMPGLCSDELLAGCAALVRRHALSAQTHLVESKVQAVAAHRRWGKSMVEHLDDLELLGPWLVAGHSVWVDDDDIARMAESGTVVAHNPASNLRLGNGVAPVGELLAAGVTVALGSDGCHASDNQNMFEAMRFAALVGRSRAPYRPESWVGAEQAWRMATESGAAALGMRGEIGAITPGARADLSVVRADSPLLTPAGDLLNLLVYSETGADVEHVFVDGRHVVDEGKVTTVDERQVLAAAERAAEDSRRRSEARFEFADRLDPFVQSTCHRLADEDLGFDRFGAEPRAMSMGER